jgi:hypothetical protein
VFELLSTYQAGQEASLLVKAAFNLDLLLAFPGDVALRDRPCGSATPVGNNLAFLAAFAIGNTHLIDLPPGSEGGFGGDDFAPAGGFGGDDFAPEAVPATTTPTLVFATQPGQAIRLSALFLDGGVARALCHDPATAPTAGDAAPNADLSWPASDAVVELDAIVADGWSLAVGERAANPLGFRLASGTAARRLQAFASASPLPQRAAAVTAIQAQASATRLGALAGAVPSWGALRAAAVGRTQALIAVETLPPEAGADAFDHEVVTALEHPTCGDGVCGWDSVAGAAESCVVDCEGPALPPPPPPAKVMVIVEPPI